MLEYNQDQNQNASSQTVAPLPTSETTVVTAPVIQLKSTHKWWLWIVVVLVLVLLGSGGWWYYAKGQIMFLAKDMTWPWSVSYDNYKMSQNLKVELSNLSQDENLVFNFTDMSLQVDGFVDLMGNNFSGESKIASLLDAQDFEATIRYKKIEDIFYLGADLPEDWIAQVPFEINDTWIAIDQGALEENSLLPKETLENYSTSFKDFGAKFNSFLAVIKEQKLVLISDPHQTKDWSAKTLKKVDFKLDPEKIEAFSLAYLETFTDPATFETLKKNLENTKTQDPEIWENWQNFMSQINFSLWVDKDSKDIFGVEAQLNKFSLSQDGQSLMDVSLSFSQMMEEIEQTTISVPAKVMSIEEILNSLFMGVQINDGEPVDILSILSADKLLEVQRGVNLCLQNSKTFNAPDTNTKICDDLLDVPNWPVLDNGYQWSKEYSFSEFENSSLNFCIYKEGVPGITCSYSDGMSSCFYQACSGNVDLESTNSLDSDGDLLSDEEEMNEYLTNPNSYDTDSDGLDDGLEVLQFLTDPNDQDSDNDTYLDGQEVNNGYNPMGAGKLVM